MKTLVYTIDRINETLAKLVAWLVAVLVLAMAYEVAARYLFRSPTAWSYDVSYFLNSIIVVFGAAYTLRRGGHVRIDILYLYFAPRTRALLDLFFTLLLFIPLWSLLLWSMVPHIQQSWATGERALTGTWLPPIYPFKTWVFVGLALLLLQGIAEAIRSAILILKGEELDGP